MNEYPLMREKKGNKVLFYPSVPRNAAKYVADTLGGRWIGQGPKVEKFERDFSKKFCGGQQALAVGSGTDALHLAYMLAGLKAGDEVIAPVFTCTATNIPFLYMGVKIRFADVDPETMNIDVGHVRRLMNDKVRAIVCVHYAGLPCNMDELLEIAEGAGIPVIEDAAHAIGATYRGRSIGEISHFTMYSFQAIKHFTTGDGGMLSLRDPDLRSRGELLRWFGIDRSAKQGGIWENDICEVGYKYQMTDIAAAMGLAALEEIDEFLAIRRSLFQRYCERLEGCDGVRVIGANFEDREHAAWLLTVLVENRKGLMTKLREDKVESAQVHYRNDRYSIFKEFARDEYPNMDSVEDKYLVLPLHTKLTIEDVDSICELIKQGW
jgi:dTDP-4-amino-4,6-dideoxygalactose transaminase